MGRRNQYTANKGVQRPQGAKRRSLLDVWVDGSFQPHAGNLAGGAVARRDRDGRLVDVLAFRFDGATVGGAVTESRDAERLAILHALEACEPDSVGRLVCDCVEAISRVKDIQTGRLNARKFNGPVFERLRVAIGRQPSMEIESLRRAEGSIPIANAFAQAAARGDIVKLEAESRRFRAAFTYADSSGPVHHYNPHMPRP